MALTSPGVEVTIIDQSQYLPAPAGSVPLVVLATAQNKANPTGTGVAVGTTAANAGKLYQVTSQRDLVNLYGTPFFYTTTNGTPIQGYELNEYGLLAAYSLLGTTNRCYVLRADIDLASLVGQTGRPVGAPAAGSWWLDTTTTNWGIYRFNRTSGSFVLQTPIVISDAAQLSGSAPLNSIGNVGQYAVNATIEGNVSPTSAATYWYKTTDNVWVALGSTDWANDIPCVQGTASNPTLTPTNSFDITVNGQFTATITVGSSPSNNNVTALASQINGLGYSYLRAAVVSGRLTLYTSLPGIYGGYLNISNPVGNVLTQLGITIGNYLQPDIQYGTSAQMPLWSTGQSSPHPTGSVWIKVGSSGLGLNPIVSEYSTTTASWQAKNVALETSDWAISAILDATGGLTIPAGTVYGQYTVAGQFDTGPVYLWERSALGQTVVTGTETNFTLVDIPSTTQNLYVQVSIPGAGSLSGSYTVSISNGNTPTDVVAAWQAARIPFTTASVTTDGAVQLTHTFGGEILINDIIQTSGVDQGFSAGILEQMGFVVGMTNFTKFGTSVPVSFTALLADSQTGGGTLATFNVSKNYNVYLISGSGVTNPGGGYAVGDTITILGSNLGGVDTANDLTLIVAEVGVGGAIASVTYSTGSPSIQYNVQCSNWVELMFTANEGAPVAAPANGTNWFYSVIDEVDIMVNANGQWNGYKNINYSSSGFPLPSGVNTTDPNGPIIAATEPTTQSDGTALVYGDLWINTTDLEMYPVISRWQDVGGTDAWVLIDNADQTSSLGVLFADARWATNGDTSPIDDPIPTIKSLLSSDYLDLDAPNPAAYPTGMLLFNSRRSGYNVKQYIVNYFNSISFPGQSLPNQTSAWVTESGLQSNGSPYMGRQAQRAMVVKSLRSVIDTNTDIRDEDNFFNLMATPYYPELQPNMVVLNADRGETGYIIGDTPMRLPPNATDIQAWATNAAGATSTGEEGLVTRNTYLGLFYPSGITSDLSGNLVAVPPSHMMLRTFLRNDTISYPWLAAAGTRRGIIDNATNIGYVDSVTGEFVTTKTQIGIRDVLYINFINPLVFFTGIGLLNYGNKTSFNSSSALDRTNVARLIAYVRRQLTLAARPFVFEPNDALTRNQIAGVVQTLMVDLKAKRGIYDYLVICDESNNTPARIDRNELWVDVALEPVKAAEFIYIPVRVLNTGEIASL